MRDRAIVRDRAVASCRLRQEGSRPVVGSLGGGRSLELDVQIQREKAPSVRCYVQVHHERGATRGAEGEQLGAG